MAILVYVLIVLVLCLMGAVGYLWHQTNALDRALNVEAMARNTSDAALRASIELVREQVTTLSSVQPK